MKLAILLGVLTIALTFIVGGVASTHGPNVLARFLERDTRYTPEELRHWVSENVANARAYAFPVLFPLDVLFLVCFGGFLASGSRSLGSEIGISGGVHRWLLAAPVVYVAADLLEDAALAWMLTSAARITPATVQATKVLTTVKLATSSIGIVQLTVLAAIAVWKDS